MTDDGGFPGENRPEVRENDPAERDEAKETDPWMPAPGDFVAPDEEASERVTAYLTPSGKEVLETLASQSDYSKSAIIREAFQDHAYRLATQNPENFSSAQLNYLARRRAMRDRITRNRVATFKKRVDDAVQNRINWSTHPEMVEKVAREFLDVNRSLYEAGVISDDLFEEHDRYVHKQFGKYDAALEQSNKRDERRVTDTMTGIKENGQFAQAIEDAARSYIRYAETGDREAAQHGDTFATEAARNSGDKPPEMPTTKPHDRAWCIERAKERAVEGEESHGEACLLDRAGEAYSEGRERRGDALVEACVELYPNDHDPTFEGMRDRARQRAQLPRDGDDGSPPVETPEETTEAATEPPAPETPGMDIDATPVVADADGGVVEDPPERIAFGWFIEAGNASMDDPDPSEAPDEEAAREQMAQLLAEKCEDAMDTDRTMGARVRDACEFAGPGFHPDDYSDPETVLTEAIDGTYAYLLPEGEDAGDILDRARNER